MSSLKHLVKTAVITIRDTPLRIQPRMTISVSCHTDSLTSKAFPVSPQKVDLPFSILLLFIQNLLNFNRESQFDAWSLLNDNDLF